MLFHIVCTFKLYNFREPSRGYTPFMRAAADGNEMIVQLFIEYVSAVTMIFQVSPWSPMPSPTFQKSVPLTTMSSVLCLSC